MYYDKTMIGVDYSAAQAPVSAVQAVRHDWPAPEAQWPSVAFQLPKGTWFDEGLDIRDPEGTAFTQHILEIIAPFEGLKIGRSAIKADNHRMRVRKLLANALRCFYYYDPGLVAFFRKAGRLPNKPEWFTGTGMRSATDAFAKAGLINMTSGQPGSASTFEATEALVFAARDFGVVETSLTYRMPRERLVRLYETNRDGPYAHFDPTDETHRWAAMLETFNGFLDQQSIALNLSFADEARIVSGLNDKRRPDMPRHQAPDLSRTNLYRQFNNGSFEDGGRLYGGWWIHVPEHLRSRITIDDEPTVELDYSGCAIRMLYHLRGLECHDDPYHLEEVAALEANKGFRAGHFRQAIKRLVQARINGADRDKDMMCDLKEEVSFSPHFTRDRVTAMIETKHEAISDAFGSGAGIKLQRMDSDLALLIVTELMRKQIVSLPIHDSFIVKQIYKDQLYVKMKEIYRNMFGFNPVIK